MTNKNNKNSNNRVNQSDIGLDLENLTPEQLRELVEKISNDLTAAAKLSDEALDSTSENAPRPPWIHFT